MGTEYRPMATVRRRRQPKTVMRLLLLLLLLFPWWLRRCRLSADTRRQNRESSVCGRPRAPRNRRPSCIYRGLSTRKLCTGRARRAPAARAIGRRVVTAAVKNAAVGTTIAVAAVAAHLVTINGQVAAENDGSVPGA